MGRIFSCCVQGRRATSRDALHAGLPGYVRGVAASGAGEWLVATANGQVARWRPGAQESEILTSGYDRLHGVAAAPGGDVVFAEAGGGRVLRLRAGETDVLASGLDEPMGVATDAEGGVYVSESGGGRVLKVAGGRSETVLDGLGAAQAIVIDRGTLYVVDALGTSPRSRAISCSGSGVSLLPSYRRGGGAIRALARRAGYPAGRPHRVHARAAATLRVLFSAMQTGAISVRLFTLCGSHALRLRIDDRQPTILVTNRHNPDGDAMYIDGSVTRKFEENGKKYIEINQQATTHRGEVSAFSSSIAELPSRRG